MSNELGNLRSSINRKKVQMLRIANVTCTCAGTGKSFLMYMY